MLEVMEIMMMLIVMMIMMVVDSDDDWRNGVICRRCLFGTVPQDGLLPCVRLEGAVFSFDKHDPAQ